MDYFVTACFCFCFASLIEFAAVNYFTVTKPRYILKEITKATRRRRNSNSSDCNSEEDEHLGDLNMGPLKMKSICKLVTKYHQEDQWCRHSYTSTVLQHEEKWITKKRKRLIKIFKWMFFSRADLKRFLNERNFDKLQQLRVEAIEAMAGDSPIDRISRIVFPLAFFTWKGSSEITSLYSQISSSSFEFFFSRFNFCYWIPYFDRREKLLEEDSQTGFMASS